MIIQVIVGELIAKWLGFLPIWICDYCGAGFYTMHGCQWHEGHDHPRREYCTTEKLTGKL